MLVPGLGLRLRCWMLRPLTTIISGTSIVGATQIMRPSGRPLLTIAFTQGFQYCMSRPSLLCVPYRYKAGVLYSQVPSSNLGDFTVTRSASNSATRVNAAGLIERVNDNMPRLDYPLGGITAGCPALLVEPAATNLHTHSEAFASNYTTVLNLTPSGTNLTAPDNTSTADRFFETTTNDVHIISIAPGFGFALTSGTVYTFSVFAQSIGGRNFRLNLTVGGSLDVLYTLSGSGSVSNTSVATIQNYGNNWYRCTYTFTATSSVNFRQNIYSVNGTTNTFIGDVTKGFIVWGAQLETGPIATSYIPTAASPVTRGAETCTATVGPFNSGSVYIAISDNDPQPCPGTHVSGALAVLGASPLNLYVSRSNNTRNRLWTQAASVIYTTTQDDLRLAFTWSGANINVFQNGTKVVTNSPYAITGVHTIRFGSTEVRNRITALAVYDSVLTDVQLQSLTQ